MLDGHIATTGTLNVQVGINGGSNDVINIAGSMGSVTATSLLTATYKTSGAVVASLAGTAAERQDVFDKIDAGINTLKSKITAIGSYQNRLDSAAESIEVARSNLSSALSTVRDADVSTESSNYIKAQILQQAAASLLTTANQSPSIALNLI